MSLRVGRHGGLGWHLPACSVATRVGWLAGWCCLRNWVHTSHAYYQPKLAPFHRRPTALPARPRPSPPSPSPGPPKMVGFL